MADIKNVANNSLRFFHELVFNCNERSFFALHHFEPVPYIATSRNNIPLTALLLMSFNNFL